MKVIFLDIDGVLNSELWYRNRYESVIREEIEYSYPYYEFDPGCVYQLNRILDSTGSKIVVSSTWRIGKSIQELQELFGTVGIIGEVIDTTPSFFAKGSHNDTKIGYTIPRGCEIDWWLNEKGKFQRINWSKLKQLEYLEKSDVKNYVILDDDSDMLYSQREHFVKTHNYTGLTEETADKAIEILNTPIVKLYYY